MTKGRRAAALTFSDQLLPIDLAIRDWSRREPTVAERLRRVDNFRIEYLRSLLGPFCDDEDELEAGCLIAFSVAIADHLIAADHRGRNRQDLPTALCPLEPLPPTPAASLGNALRRTSELL